jgi:pyruvate/2-oxoglutarate dehydrogenase complex dihydrolipoamide acyltransferase (E2) component
LIPRGELIHGGEKRCLLKTGSRGREIEPREILNLTVMFDHDIVDGAPAARFMRRLVELIESGYGL